MGFQPFLQDESRVRPNRVRDLSSWLSLSRLLSFFLNAALTIFNCPLWTIVFSVPHGGVVGRKMCAQGV